MGLREQKKLHTRRALLDTAITLFRSVGYEETRIVDVVAEVGVSEATFFNYFPSKDALLEEYVLESKEAYTALLEYEVRDTGRPVVDRICELVQLVGTSFSGDREFMAILLGRTSLFFGSTGPSKVKDHENFELLADLFRQGQRGGEIRSGCDPLQLAEILTSIQLLTIANWVTGWWDDSGQLDPRLSEAMAIFLQGCQSG